MSSSTSIFKIYRPLLMAIGCIIAIECLCAVFLPSDLALLQSPLLHMAYKKQIYPERLIAVSKMEMAYRLPADIIQIGESSGLTAVQPDTIDPMLSGHMLLNLSLTLPSEFAGFEAAEEIGLRTHPEAKYVMAIFSPLHLSVKTEGFGDDLYKDYVDFPVWKYFPSLKARAAILNLFYYQTLSARDLYNIPCTSSDDARSKCLSEIFNSLISTRGWFPIHFHHAFVPAQCMAPYDKELSMQRLQSLYDIAKKHNAGFIIVLSPIRCTPDALTANIARDVQDFIDSHPGAFAPLPLIYPVAPEWLGDEVHLVPEASSAYSKILGESLSKQLVKNTATAP